MCDENARAYQPKLFRIEVDDQDRASCGSKRESSRQFQHACRARRVVVGAEAGGEYEFGISGELRRSAQVIVVRADDDVLRSKAGVDPSDDGSDILAAMIFDIEELKECCVTARGRLAVSGKDSMQSEREIATCDLRRCAVAAGASRSSPLESWIREIGDVGFGAWRRWNWRRELTAREIDESEENAELHSTHIALGADRMSC